MPKSLYTKVPAKKRISNDPIIHHIKRGIKTIRDIGKAFSIVIPGVGGRSLLNKATRALQKVNRGY